MKGLSTKRDREEESCKTTYFWDPFNVPSSPKRLVCSQENLENDGLVENDEWLVGSPNSQGKRALETPSCESFLRSKRGNFSDVSPFSQSLGKRSSSSSPSASSPAELADVLTKRSRLMEALATKRRLDESFGSDLRANKKVLSSDEAAEDDMALVCVARSVPAPDVEDDLWFGDAPLSRVPPAVFATSSPSSQLVVWEDHGARFKRLFGKKPFPPLMAAINKNVPIPRVEVLDSSEEEEQVAPHQSSPIAEDFDGVVPMDLSD